MLARFFALLLVANLALLAVYEFVTFKYEVHSDSAVKVVLANEILETGELFPHDWVYANGDLYAFFSNTLAIPLVQVFGAGFFTHALVGMMISLALLGLTALLLRELPFQNWQRLALLAFLASGISSLFAENLYGQATYGFILLLNVAVVVVALAFTRRFDASTKPDLRLLVVLGGLSLMVHCNNPRRAAIMLSAPLIAACVGAVLNRMGGRWSLNHLRRVPAAWVALGHLAGAALGAGLSSRVLSRPLNDIDTAGAINWVGTDAIWRSLVHAVSGTLAQLGGLPQPGYSVVSGWGVYESGRLVLGLVLLWGAVRAVRTQVTSDSEPLRFMANFTAVSGGLSLFIFVFTNIPDMTNPMGSARYLLPTLFMGLVLLPSLMTKNPRVGGKLSLFTFGAVTLTALMGFMTLAIPGYGSTGRTWAEARTKGEARLALLEFLEKEGLHYGYASYWNSSVLTLLSDGRVKVRSVNLEAMLSPGHLHSSNRWFRSTEWAGDTFLLMSQDELSKINRPMLDSRLGPPRTLSFGQYRVLVYRKNFSGLPGWADLVDHNQRFPVTPDSFHQIGSYQQLAPGQGSLVASKEMQGELLFGPFMWISSGRYQVSFDLQAEGDGPLGTLQITGRQSSVVLATQALEAGARKLRVLEFEVPTEEKFVEFRVISNGKGAISVFGTSIQQLLP